MAQKTELMEKAADGRRNEIAEGGENFLLPKTEAALERIISGAEDFFLFSRFVLYALYFVYALLRVFVYKNFFAPGLAAACVSFALVLLYFLEYFVGLEFPRAVRIALKIVWRLSSLFVAAFLFKKLLDFAAGKDFGEAERFFALEIIFTLLCLLGWILAVLGDVFSLTVPLWTREILSSFKSDIELGGLAGRSFKKAKEEFKEAGGRLVQRSGKKLAAGAAASALALGIGAIRRAFKKR